jgi:hypothetical protein
MRFDRSWAVFQLDRGDGMKVHPVTGESLKSLSFNGYLFYIAIHRGGWDYDCEHRYRERISEGRDVQKGEGFPSHWRYDPYTGQPLEASDGRKLWDQD